MNEINKSPIYTILAIQDIKFETGETVGSERLVGFYHEKDIALWEVEHNSCDICEKLYEYVLVEESNVGFYKVNKNRWLFQYDDENDCYKEVSQPKYWDNYYTMIIG